MADSSTFKAKKVPVKPTKTGGVDLKKLLDFAGGVDAVIQEAGVTGRDARQLRKAAEAMSSSGNQYLLKKGGFDVFDEDGNPLTKSAKGIGNKKGLDVGDLIGLGNASSKLAGVLSGYKNAFEESKKPKPKTDPDVSSEKTTAGPNTDVALDPFGKVLRDAAARRQVAKTPSPRETLVNPPDKPNKPIIDQTDNTPANRRPGSWDVLGHLRPYEKTTKATAAKKSDTRDQPLFSGPRDFMNSLIGDFTNIADSDFYSTFGTAFNPAQLWSAEAKAKARSLGKEHGKDDDPNRVISALPDAGILDIIPGGGVAKGLLRKGVDLTKQAIKTGGKSAAKTATKIVKTEADALLEIQRIAKSNLSAAEKASRINQLRKLHNLDKVNKGTRVADDVVKKGADKNFDEWAKMNDRIEGAGGFNKKGGKLPKFRLGGKPVVNRNPGGLTIDKLKELSIGGYNPDLAPEKEWTPNALIRGYDPSLAMEKEQTPEPILKRTHQISAPQKEWTPDPLLKGYIPGLAPEKEIVAPEVETDPLYGLKDQNKNKENRDSVGAASLAGGYLSQYLRGKAFDKTIANVKYSPQDLMVGIVQDDVRGPSFRRTTPPDRNRGTDVQAMMAGSLGYESMARAEEERYNARNAQSRREQKAQVLNRINQQRAQNNQGQLRADMFNAQAKQMAGAQKYQQGLDLDIGTMANIAQRRSENAYLNEARRQSDLDRELKYSNLTPEQIKKLQEDEIPTGRKGGKLKFKTRYGRRS